MKLKSLLFLLLKIIIYIVLILWTVIEIYPIIFMFMSGLKTNMQFVTSPWTLPWPPQFINWWQILIGTSTRKPLALNLLNSVVICGIALVVLIFVSSLAGYAFSRHSFRGKKVLFNIFLVAIIIPAQIILIPIYKLMENLHLTNNYLGLILLYAAFGVGFGVMIMRTAFEVIPKEIEDAARIDGCSEYSVFWRVAMPMSKGSIFAVAAVNAVWMWGELLFAYLLMHRPAVRTLNVAILSYRGLFYDINWVLIFAGLSLSSLPLLILYLIFNKQIMKGISFGAIK